MPDFWDVNALRVEAAGVSAETMLAAVDERFASSEHRKLVVEDEATGAAVRPFFAARGWLNERDAMMRRVGPPLPVAHDVREVPVAATRGLRIEWILDYFPDPQFPLRAEPILARRGARAFMAGDDGFAILCGDAEVDALYVRPAARGRGIGASLVGAALAGVEVAWIVADDAGDARRLYERLGFETVWRPHVFVRRPS